MTGTTALVPIVSASASSSTTSTSSTLSAYELDRLAQIRANDALFRSLGLAPDDPVARVKRPASQRPVYEKVRSSPRKRQRSERNVEPRNTNGLVNGGHGWNGKLGQANSAYRRAEGAERVVDPQATAVIDLAAVAADVAAARKPLDSVQAPQQNEALRLAPRGVKDAQDAVTDADDGAVDSYEAERLARIRENEELLLSLGLFVPPVAKVVKPKPKPLPTGIKSWTSPRNLASKAEEAKAAREKARRLALAAAQRAKQVRKQEQRQETRERRAEVHTRHTREAIRMPEKVSQQKKTSKMPTGSAVKSQIKPHVFPAQPRAGKLSAPSYAVSARKARPTQTRAPVGPRSSASPNKGMPTAPLISPPPSLRRSISSGASTSSTVILTPPPAMPTLHKLLSREPPADSSTRRSPRSKADVSYSLYYPGKSTTAEFYDLMREQTALSAGSLTIGQLWPKREDTTTIKTETAENPVGFNDVGKSMVDPPLPRRRIGQTQVWVEIPYRRTYRDLAAKIA